MVERLAAKRIVLMALAAAVLLLGTRLSASPKDIAGASAGGSEFLEGHWPADIAAQGRVPIGFPDVEASLHPSQCGICHPSQLADWAGSRHARAMGPGVAGQIVHMIEEEDDAGARICYRCHAPLWEQSRVKPEGNFGVPNRLFDAGLEATGVSCAVCHVRNHRRFGPPRRAELPPLPTGRLPHDGAEYREDFQRSEFCKPCHQFDPDDSTLNGKLIENTYEEWRLSEYASYGVQCQDCHMPDRKHAWKGIHSKEMVESALKVDVTLDSRHVRPGKKLKARIVATNEGAGHNLPTYLTPKIRLEAELVDPTERSVAGSRQTWMIGWEASLDLSEEKYDTRIPPKGSRTFPYTAKVTGAGQKLRVTATVFPDHFYEQFFEASIPLHESKSFKHQLRTALDETRRSSFVLFQKTIPIP